MPLIPDTPKTRRGQKVLLRLAGIAAFSLMALSNAKAASWDDRVMTAWDQQMAKVHPVFQKFFQNEVDQLIATTAQAHALTDSQSATLKQAAPELVQTAIKGLKQYYLTHAQEELHGSSDELIAKLKAFEWEDSQISWSLPYYLRIEHQNAWAEKLQKVFPPEAFSAWQQEKNRLLKDRQTKTEAILKASQERENPTEELEKRCAALFEDLQLETFRPDEKSRVQALLEQWKQEYIADGVKFTLRQLDVGSVETFDSYWQMHEQGHSLYNGPQSITWLEPRLPELLEILPPSARSAFETQRQKRAERTREAQLQVCALIVELLVPLSESQRRAVDATVRETSALDKEQFLFDYQIQPWTFWQEKPASEKLAALLDDLQERLWTQGAKQMSEGRHRISKTTLPPKPPERHPGLGPPHPEAVEMAISEFLAQDSSKNAQSGLAPLLKRAEEAVRVLSLDESARNRLTLAARGTMENRIADHRRQQSRYLRTQMQNANAQNIQQRLAGFSGYSFRRQDSEKTLFDRELGDLLNPDQEAALQQHQEACRQRRYQVQIALLLARLDRALNLSDSQHSALSKALLAIMTQYGEDMDAVFSHYGDQLPWFFQQYYLYLPAAGLDAVALQVLTPRQKPLWEETVMQNGGDNWDQVIENHHDRLNDP